MHEDSARMTADIPILKDAALLVRLVQSLHKTKNMVRNFNLYEITRA